jgi:hypothetical protein
MLWFGGVERVEDVRAWPTNQPPGQSDGSTESYDRRRVLYSEGNGSALHSAQHSAAGSGVVERVEDVRAWPANQPPGQSDGSTESYDRRKGHANSGSARLLPTRGVKRSLGTEESPEQTEL